MRRTRWYGVLGSLLGVLVSAGVALAAAFAPANYYSVPAGGSQCRVYGDGRVSYSDVGTDVTGIKLFVGGSFQASHFTLVHTLGTLYTDYSTFQSSSTFAAESSHQVETVAYDGTTEIAWDYSQFVF